MAKLTDAEKRVIVDGLIANECCWKDEDRPLLNTLSDEGLTLLASTDKRTKEYIANAMPPALAKAIAEKKAAAAGEDPEEEDPEEEDAPPAKNKKVKNAKTKNAGCGEEVKPTANALTAEQQEDIAFARQIKQERKNAAIAIITANTLNKFTKEQLGGMQLDVLQGMAALATPTAPVANSEQNVAPYRPNYFGASGGAVNGQVTNQSATDEEPLPLPTINWKEEAAAQRGKR